MPISRSETVEARAVGGDELGELRADLSEPLDDHESLRRRLAERGRRGAERRVGADGGGLGGSALAESHERASPRVDSFGGFGTDAAVGRHDRPGQLDLLGQRGVPGLRVELGKRRSVDDELASSERSAGDARLGGHQPREVQAGRDQLVLGRLEVEPPEHAERAAPLRPVQHDEEAEADLGAADELDPVRIARARERLAGVEHGNERRQPLVAARPRLVGAGAEPLPLVPFALQPDAADRAVTHRVEDVPGRLHARHAGWYGRARIIHEVADET